MNNQFSISQVLYTGGTDFTANTNERVLGAVDYLLFDFNINVPSGYHKEYILSAQITTTGGAIKIGAKLNNISTELSNTWSVDTYRRLIVSSPFKLSDIVLEQVKNYPEQQGTNLYIVCNNGTGTANIYNITITCFLVKD